MFLYALCVCVCGEGGLVCNWLTVCSVCAACMFVCTSQNMWTCDGESVMDLEHVELMAEYPQSAVTSAHGTEDLQRPGLLCLNQQVTVLTDTHTTRPETT